MAAEAVRLRASAMLKIRGIRADYSWLTGRLALAMAERTAQATNEIGGMITSIQSEARLAVDSIKSEIVHVNESAESASRASSTGRRLHGRMRLS